MDHHVIENGLQDLLIVIGSGLLSGLVCKRLGVSLLIGHLAVGALIGPGGFGLVGSRAAGLEHLAEVGALLLLFAVGIEFSLGELVHLGRFLVVGGGLQMGLVTLPLMFIGRSFGLSWPASILAAAAGALSSTVLVFKALTEVGEQQTPHGKRAVGILLFQDVALVPLLLLVPLLTGQGEAPTFAAYAWLAVKSLLLISSIIVIQFAINRWLVPLLIDLRSVELLVLFTITVLLLVVLLAHQLELPPAIGALGAGLVLSGQRLSKQIDKILLPFRETFSAVFFVSLGLMLNLATFAREPVLIFSGVLGVLFLKTTAAAIALRAVGLDWKAALGMGLGLAQMGEFSYLLIAQAVDRELITPTDYNRMLCIGLATLILTPQLIQWGLQLVDVAEEELKPHTGGQSDEGRSKQAIVVGIGPIGQKVAGLLRSSGIETHLIDLSPVNLQPLAQEGYSTIAGDARDPDVLARAEIRDTVLAVVCVPSDDIAVQVVQSLRQTNPSTAILVRCRFESNVGPLERAGALAVVSEELEASTRLLAHCQALLNIGAASRLAPRQLGQPAGDEDSLGVG